jgi:hypothetical protein
VRRARAGPSIVEQHGRLGKLAPDAGAGIEVAEGRTPERRTIEQTRTTREQDGAARPRFNCITRLTAAPRASIH